MDAGVGEARPADTIAPVAAALSSIGNLVAGSAARDAGQAARTAAYFKAAQYDENATAAVAAGTRNAEEERLKANLLASRAIAVGASSGGAATDPTVTKIVSDIAGRGAYNAGVALYNAEESARQMRMQGSAARYEGEMAAIGGRQKQAGYELTAGANLAQASSLFAKYGRSGPKAGRTDVSLTPSMDE